MNLTVNELSPVHLFTASFSKIYFNIILSSATKTSVVSSLTVSRLRFRATRALHLASLHSMP